LTTKVYQVDFELVLAAFGSALTVDFHNYNDTNTQTDYFGFEIASAVYETNFDINYDNTGAQSLTTVSGKAISPAITDSTALRRLSFGVSTENASFLFGDAAPV